ncbi:hypothetical protein PVAP13_1NG114214 [Panicum virgatum]|uniref:Uncharacterized protein n=1 Tax=Panicum virgatum TaxID=38727 RepID=A0A8T0WX96_PANVG|nr:hypothetical protein PVAP13_1NG114214 [Panicum virgatum]
MCPSDSNKILLMVMYDFTIAALACRQPKKKSLF